MHGDNVDNMNKLSRTGYLSTLFFGFLIGYRQEYKIKAPGEGMGALC